MTTFDISRARFSTQAAWLLISVLAAAVSSALAAVAWVTDSRSDTALVIQWHVLGMYVPSFFTGHLVRLWGESRVMYAGLGLFLASVLVNLAGHELLHYSVGLTLLGLGWNLPRGSSSVSF